MTTRAGRGGVRAALIGLIVATPLAAQAPEGAAERVDAIFAAWNTRTTPGCVVGVAREGRPLLTKAYGMADLERGVPLSTGSILEAGSVSKQFTAAATVLLAEEGRLSLDDDVRRWIPELPDYGTPITIRHLLNHTSGLRDWGSVAGIAGWGRSERTHTNAHALDILVRQRALNYTPGERYSYTNSGYNLLAIIVERASGESLARYTTRRIFEPLGMRDTQWRDDHTRIVPGRAIAYAGSVARGWTIDQPHEDAHGNGGLLTTVTDLLRWDQARAAGRIGGPAFRRTMETTGVLNDGSGITYAAGLVVDTYRGVAEVAHTGSTGGYRAFLGRYPESGAAVALLCNAADADRGSAGRRAVEPFLGLEPAVAQGTAGDDGAAPPSSPSTPDAAALAGLAGTYHSPDAEATFVIEAKGTEVVLLRRPADRFPLRPTGPDTFQSPLGTIVFVRDAAGAVTQLSVRQARVYDLRFDRVVH